LIDGKLRSEQLAQGDMVLVPAEAWHRNGSNQAGGAVMIGFDPGEFMQTADQVVVSAQIELVPHFATPDPLVHQIGLALKQTLEKAESTSKLYAETMTNALMVHLLQHYSV
jgi:AraC family transcriptional regulator